MLRRYRSDPSHVVSVEEIEVGPDLTFKDESVQILDRNVKVLRRKSIHLVKVLWQNHGTEEATWEPKDSMRVDQRAGDFSSLGCTISDTCRNDTKWCVRTEGHKPDSVIHRLRQIDMAETQ
ncbi:ABC transporter G family member 33-like [Gossypium australe]|uniref:ABC transporter G family member 33-like n=1 Tax=Gossypium australe TaxID=47621 RepID=A0A5B6V7R4_9ROSI|nr:ABC transporter G family member 33-like [Gossypium australe]